MSCAEGFAALGLREGPDPEAEYSQRPPQIGIRNEILKGYSPPIPAISRGAHQGIPKKNKRETEQKQERTCAQPLYGEPELSHICQTRSLWQVWKLFGVCWTLCSAGLKWCKYKKLVLTWFGYQNKRKDISQFKQEINKLKKTKNDVENQNSKAILLDLFRLELIKYACVPFPLAKPRQTSDNTGLWESKCYQAHTGLVESSEVKSKMVRSKRQIWEYIHTVEAEGKSKRLWLRPEIHIV